MIQEIQTLVTILRHQALVASQMRKLAHLLIEAADIHDLSKLSPWEFTGFVEFNHVARENKLGSPEYQQSLKDNEGVIGLHYKSNRHHPEHHSHGIENMGLVDLVEMVADWRAASAVYGQTSFEEALPILRERFGLDQRHLYLVWLIHNALAGTGEER
jgi:hypothetical protein